MYFAHAACPYTDKGEALYIAHILRGVAIVLFVYQVVYRVMSSGPLINY